MGNFARSGEANGKFRLLTRYGQKCPQPFAGRLVSGAKGGLICPPSQAIVNLVFLQALKREPPPANESGPGVVVCELVTHILPRKGRRGNE